MIIENLIKAKKRKYLTVVKKSEDFFLPISIMQQFQNSLFSMSVSQFG